MDKRKNSPKAVVIFNSKAGIETKKDVAEMVAGRLKKLGYSLTWLPLTSDFEEKIKKYSFSNAKLMVAVGGDGTVKVAVRTILKNNLKIPLAIIPFGSANVIALEFGIPFSLKRALKLFDRPEKTSWIDTGLINGCHYFVVGFSVGYISQVVTETSDEIKKRLGFFGYPLRFVFNKIKIKRMKFKIKTAERTFWIKGNSLIVFNALNYFGLKTKKKIDPADGVLNLFVLTNKTFVSLLKIFFHLVWFQNPPQQVFTVDGQTFEISLGRPQKSCQIDGDYLELPEKIKIEIIPRAVKVITGR